MPWFGLHRGIEGVEEVYTLILANLEVLAFEPHVAFGEGEDAAMFGRFRYRAKSTGKIVESDWAIHAVVRGGRFVGFHFYEDDYTLATAFRHEGGWEVENHLGRRRVP
jgi:ketosteroid isomerase-like protein